MGRTRALMKFPVLCPIENRLLMQRQRRKGCFPLSKMTFVIDLVWCIRAFKLWVIFLPLATSAQQLKVFLHCRGNLI